MPDTILLINPLWQFMRDRFPYIVVNKKKMYQLMNSLEVLSPSNIHQLPDHEYDLEFVSVYNDDTIFTGG